MTLAAVRATEGGCSGLNATIMGLMCQWAKGIAREMGRRDDPNAKMAGGGYC